MRLLKHFREQKEKKSGGGSSEPRGTRKESTSRGEVNDGTFLERGENKKKEGYGMMGNNEGNEAGRERGRMEKTLYTKKIITRNKAFFLDLKENNNGKFLKVTESSGDKRSFVFVPEEGLKEFCDSLSEILQDHI